MSTASTHSSTSTSWWEWLVVAGVDGIDVLADGPVGEDGVVLPSRVRMIELVGELAVGGGEDLAGESKCGHAGDGDDPASRTMSRERPAPSRNDR